MLPILKLYGIAFIVFFVVDLIWLGLVAKDLYNKEIGSLLKPDVNWAAAIIFYLLFILGLVIFVIEPSVTAGSLGKVMLLGAFFGLVTYATYDLTSLASMQGFTVNYPPLNRSGGFLSKPAFASDSIGYPRSPYGSYIFITKKLTCTF